ncbi:MAG: NTP transferase domain-containing protein [Nanoarchaeota archaeon]|nr:NTP transferase domain-containing protein [Nanoarchaeota archaeon]MBU1004920.1 NTP transferase domain-containing protein [Nanoarchaeota archaeon]MBU1945634.1 NTP transferase domain-containing protein [Nanoarchaeota archaeon]
MKERITITLKEDLIKQLDKRIDGEQIKNRSQEIETILEDALGNSIPSKALILAGGKGTRLRPLTLKIPKGLVEVQGKTLTEWLFELLKKYGIRDVILSTGYLSEKMRDYFTDGSKFGMNVDYVEEDPEKPMGTAGPLRLAQHMLKESFIVSNGDELKCINIPRMFRLHKRKNALVTIALTTVDDPTQYGVARLDGSRILEFVEKPKRKEAPSNLINSGFYIIEPEVIEMIPKGKFCMFEKDIFPQLAKEGRIRGFPFSGQWFDTGNFERLERARKLWKGIIVEEDGD